MSSDTLVIGIDVGTTNLKAVLCDSQAQLVAQTSVHYHTQTDKYGYVTQEPRLWTQALDQCMPALSSGGVDLRRVRALACSCQADTLICCDDAGRELAPAISWLDHRAIAQASRLKEIRRDWYARGGKKMSVYSPLAKILWLREHQPELVRRARRLSQVSDYMVSWLTGEWVCDLNCAAFMNFFDVAHRRWDAEICGQFELEGLLPAVRESGSSVGNLRGELAARWGLAADTRVILGGHDQGCSALGSAPPSESAVTLSAGTAWVLYCPLDKPRFDIGERLVMYCHAMPQQWAWLAAFSGGGVVDHFVRHFMHGERAQSQNENRMILDLLGREDLSPELPVIPYLFGASSLDEDPSARVAIVGLGAQHGPRQILLGLLEGIAFETRRFLDVFRELGAAPGPLKMIGGGSRSAIWPQLVADCCHCEVEALEESETAALGAAYLAGHGIGMWNDHGLPQYPAARRYVPQPDETNRQERKFREYLKAVSCDRARRARDLAADGKLKQFAFVSKSLA